jgi:hypothetical protein
MNLDKATDFLKAECHLQNKTDFSNEFKHMILNIFKKSDNCIFESKLSVVVEYNKMLKHQCVPSAQLRWR